MPDRIDASFNEKGENVREHNFLDFEHRIIGCLIGTAVADALGLPYEGLTRGRAIRMLGPANCHRFVLRHGMVSNDTEHSCMVAQALIFADGDIEIFRSDFARRLKRWFATLPAGVGLATAKACLKLWLFSPPQKSGVFSAGNGPAMRAALFGTYFDDISELKSFLYAATVVTHTDLKAYHGALAVALAAHQASRYRNVEGHQFLDLYSNSVTDATDDVLPLLQQAVDSVQQGRSVADFAAELGCDQAVSGYVLHTVPVAIHAWLSHQQDYQAAVKSTIACGGDADTTAAIVGGIVGSAVGAEGIPEQWRKDIVEWPRTIPWISRLGHQLATQAKQRQTKRPPQLNVVAVLLRNVCFLMIVLLHGFRRMLPPY